MTTPTNKSVPSEDPSDLLFNARQLDRIMNSGEAAYIDRFGQSRATVQGAVASMAAAAAIAIDDVQDAAAVTMAGLGYAPPEAYAGGIALTAVTQTVSNGGIVYAPKLADLPFTTSGVFETAKFRVIQGIVATDLASGTGAHMVGSQKPDAGAVLRDQAAINEELYSVADYDAVGDGATNNDAAFDDAETADRVALLVPHGVFNVSADKSIPMTLVGPGLIDAGGEVNDLLAWRSAKPTLHGLAGRTGDLTVLQEAIHRGSAKVVFWGDSITEGISQIAYEDSWAGLLETAIRSEFPEVTWTFVNLSIAGRGIGEANSDTFVGTAGAETPTINFNRSPGWQNNIPNHTLWPSGSTAAKPWHEHVEDEQADLVIIALGVNDTSGDANAWAASCKNILQVRMPAWTKEPSVAIVTPLLPTRKDPAYKALNAAVQANADAMRSIADELNMTLLDANRLYRAYREGVDPARTRNRYHADLADYGSWTTVTGAAPSASGGDTLTWAAAGEVVRPEPSVDVSVSASFTPTLGATVFSLRYRADPSSPAQAYVVQVQGAVPQLVLYFNGVAIASTAVPAVANGSTHALKVECQGGRHRIWLDGTLEMERYDYQRMIAGNVGVGMSAAGSMTKLRVKGGYARVVGYSEMPEDVLLGPVNDYTSNINSLGGNAINHPSIVGHYAIYFGACVPLLQAIRAEAKRWSDRVMSASASATSGSLTLNDGIDIVIAGVASPQAALCSVSTADLAYNASNFAAVDVNASSATIDLRKNGATVLATCTITFPYPGKWLVLGWGTASRRDVLLRHTLTAIAIKQQD